MFSKIFFGILAKVLKKKVIADSQFNFNIMKKMILFLSLLGILVGACKETDCKTGKEGFLCSENSRDRFLGVWRMNWYWEGDSDVYRTTNLLFTKGDKINEVRVDTMSQCGFAYLPITCEVDGNHIVKMDSMGCIGIHAYYMTILQWEIIGEDSMSIVIEYPNSQTASNREFRGHRIR